MLLILPQCSSQSPSSGDAVLAGNHAAMQDIRNEKALRKLAAGSTKYFPVFIADAGYQFVGRITLPSEKFIDLQQIIREEGGIFLGKILKLIIIWITLKRLRINDLQIYLKYSCQT